MKKTIYISGSITDQQSGKPRDGWQRDFLEAEAKLREMGFRVINPVDIAKAVEDSANRCSGLGDPYSPIRSDYIMACLHHMKTAHGAGMLHGVYVIGKDTEAMASNGVRMELLMADLLSIPIYAESKENHRVNTLLVPQAGFEGIEELLEENC